jgi:hypothetical protein
MASAVVYFPGDRNLAPVGHYFLIRVDNGDEAVICEIPLRAGAWPVAFGPVPLPEGARLGPEGNVAVYSGEYDEARDAWTPGAPNPLLTSSLQSLN